MWQKIILQLQRKKTLPDKGFLTLEIIIATLVAFAFLMSSLQALVLGMYLKVQAQEDQRANQLIQEDIEAFASLSNTLTLDLNTNCNADVYGNGYAFGLWDSFDNPGTPVSISLLSGGGGAELTLNRTHVSAINPTPPFRTLGIYYQVRNSDNDLVASRYIEMIPDQALRCP